MHRAAFMGGTVALRGFYSLRRTDCAEGIRFGSAVMNWRQHARGPFQCVAPTVKRPGSKFTVWRSAATGRFGRKGLSLDGKTLLREGAGRLVTGQKRVIALRYCSHE